jgi:hypothetical protein
MPLSSSIVASRAIPVSSGELPPLPAIAVAAPNLRLCSLLVPPVHRTVACSTQMGNVGELPTAANGGSAVSTPNSGGRAP